MKGTKPDFDRFVAALEHRETDRVPFAEAAVDYEIMGQFIGRSVSSDDLAAQVAFWTEAGYDFIPLTIGMMTPGRVTEESRISQVIRQALVSDTADEDSDETWNLEKKAWIHGEEDYEAFPWEEAGKLDLRKFHEVQEVLPAGMKIIALSGKIFTLSWMLMGFENLCMSLILNPQLVSKVIQKVAQIQFQGLKEIASIPNVAAVWAVDDIAFKTGTMLSPQSLRQHIFPWYDEFGRLCRENDLHFLFHSDGLLWDVMDDLLALGIQGLHPIDPTCMDIVEVKDRVGERLCIMGNISNELLMDGTPEEVIELTRERIRVLAPGGGYCLAAGNSVPNWARIENYRAMLAAGAEYGRYPIRVA